MTTPTDLRCPLCNEQNHTLYAQDKKRDYRHCETCALVFVPPHQRLSPDQEKAEYDLHNNSFEDEGYRQFLMRTAKPLLTILNTPSKGLDFGCGPGPVLAQILESYGHSVDLYDVFYYPDTSVLNQQYDFITATETIEHFHTPAKEWASWMSCLKPGGWLAIMTKRVIDAERFKHWHYKNDQTHVSFFSEATFHYLAKRDGLEVQFPSKDVVLMQKHG